MSVLKLLFLGDIVGSPGVGFVKRAVPVLRQRDGYDLVVANAENAAGGSGIGPSHYRQLRAAGVDAITLGDHVYKKFDIAGVMGTVGEPICKPANYPAAAPGRDCIRLDVGGVPVLVFCLMGRTFMRPVDCPFAAADRVLAANPDLKVIIVDVHAEATAEKYLLAHHLDGRVSAVLGTHTHVPTADEQLLPRGTAFQCDVGMCGPYAGVLGRKVEPVLHNAVTFEPTAFDVATGDVRLAGAAVEIDKVTGKATAFRRVMVRESEV